MELWRLSHLHRGLHKRLRKLSEVNQNHGREIIINASSISSYSVNRCLDKYSSCRGDRAVKIDPRSRMARPSGPTHSLYYLY